MKSLNSFKKCFLTSLVLLLPVFAMAGGSSGKSGGAGPGGGDFMPGTHISSDQAAERIKTLIPDVVAAFNFLEFQLRDDKIANIAPNPILVNARKKLFDAKETVFDRLKNLEFRTLTDQPCYDKFHQPKDGSVFNSQPNEICLSTQRSLEFLTTENLFRQLIGIAVHEVSHKMDCDEDEAKALQERILVYISSSSEGTLFALKISMRDDLRDLLVQLSKIENSIAQNDYPEVCRGIDGAYDTAKTVEGFMMPLVLSGLTPLRNASFDDIAVLATRARMAAGYCKDIDGPTREFTASSIISTIGEVRIENIVFVGHKDVEALKRVLQTMKRVAEETLTEIGPIK